MERWVGRVACVTGASSGIGEAVARRLVVHGMKVIGCARNIEKIQKLSSELAQEKGTLEAIRCDVTKEDDVTAMFAEIKRKYGGVDVCINNAGLAHAAPLLSGATNDWEDMLNVNVLGLCRCTREAVKSMRERSVDDGHVILLNSIGGHVVPKLDVFHFYCATKHAVTALTSGIRNELTALKSHIRVTSISPGIVETNFAPRMFSHDPQCAVDFYNHCTNLTADDVTDAIIYAVSAPRHVQVHEVMIYPTETPETF